MAAILSRPQCVNRLQTNRILHTAQQWQIYQAEDVMRTPEPPYPKRNEFGTPLPPSVRTHKLYPPCLSVDLCV